LHVDSRADDRIWHAVALTGDAWWSYIMSLKVRLPSSY
jgi:hypothetical protein